MPVPPPPAVVERTLLSEGLRPEVVQKIKLERMMSIALLDNITVKEMRELGLNMGERKRLKLVLDRQKAQERTSSALEKLEVHGIKNILEADSWVVRMVWTTVYLFFLAATIHGLYGNLLEFYTNPILTTISITEPQNLSFPKIFLCPVNFLNGSYFMYNAKNTKVKSLQKKSLSMILQFLRSNPRLARGAKSRNYPPLMKLLKWNDMWANSTEVQAYIDEMDDEMLNGTDLIEIMQMATERPTAKDQYDFMVEQSLALNQFIKYCEFQRSRRECEKMARPTLDPTGMCYMVNINETQQHPTIGLRLLLDVGGATEPVATRDGNKTIHLFGGHSQAPQDGVVVRAMRQWQVSFEASLAYPGTYSKMAMRLRKNKMITATYSKTPQICTDTRAEDAKFKFSTLHYSKLGCEMDCQQPEIYDKCGCFFPIIDIHALRPKYYNANVCNRTEYKCADDVIAAAKCDKRCHVPCESWEIDIQQSALQLPSTAYLSEFRKLVSKGLMSENATNNPEQASKSFVYLDIAFDRIQYTTYAQSPSLTINTIFSNAGGTLGLWLGASLFTMIQVIVLTIETCMNKKVEQQKKQAGKDFV